MNAFALLAQQTAVAALLATLVAAGCVVARDSTMHYGRRSAWAARGEIAVIVAAVLWGAMVGFSIAWTYTE